MRLNRVFFSALLLTLLASAHAEIIVTEGQGFGVDVNSVDGRIAMDLLGSIWVMPETGGDAKKLTDGLLPARRPRWSPDGTRLLYRVSGPDGIRIVDVADGTTRPSGVQGISGRHASWHPDGERIVFSRRGQSGQFDIWELDLPTGLEWRISDHEGDEIETAWSANGRHIAYVHVVDEGYSLILRRLGEPEVTLTRSSDPISSLSWRPDGSLLSFLRREDDQVSHYIVILSEPPIVRPMLTDVAIHEAPVSWRDRQQMFYAAEGEVRTRSFDDHRSTMLPFRAMVDEPEPPPARVIARRELEIVDAPPDRLVIRGSRLFDGIWSGYRENMDVLIDGGRIAAVEGRQDWPDATLLDLGNVAILPGLIDAWSEMPDRDWGNPGPRMLAYGVTTIVTDDTAADFDTSVWEGEDNPGPRVLPAGDVAAEIGDDDVLPYYLVVAGDEDTVAAAQHWQERGVLVLADGIRTSIRVGADLIGGLVLLPDALSDFADMSGSRIRGLTVVSGMATGRTAGLPELMRSRQSLAFGHNNAVPALAMSAAPDLPVASHPIVAGSKLNRLPPGLALHAELRALSAAGLNGEQVLHTAGSAAAKVLGLENQVGRVTPGAAADLVIVSGDPLSNIEDALSIVAVVRNGRFYSLVSLLERGN